MLSLTKTEIAKILGGKALPHGGDTSSVGVEFDTRLLQKEALFIALPGDKVHGHSFVEKAVNDGASLCLVEDESLLLSSPVADRLIAVPDSLKGLQALGAYARQQFRGPVIGVTGTIGKTTTRNILASILSTRGTVNASRKSFNNHIGVPYTLCNSDSDADFTVLEMGMNHSGELTLLTKIAQPNIAIITNVTPVHMEFFKDLHEVADAKCEIFSGLGSECIGIINGDVPELVAGVDRAQQSNAAGLKKWVVFGSKEGATYRVTRIVDNLTEGFSIEMTGPQQGIVVHVPMIGAYNSTNVVAAMVVALQVVPDLSQGEVQQALDTIKPEAHRLNLLKLGDGREILDDCYNSSPTALVSALNLLAKCKARGKEIGLVLGGMHEMGDKAEHYHTVVAQEILKLAPSFCFIVGEVGRNFVGPLNGAPFPVTWFASASEVVEATRAALFDLALVKGSRGVKLEVLIDALSAQ